MEYMIIVRHYANFNEGRIEVYCNGNLIEDFETTNLHDSVVSTKLFHTSDENKVVVKHDGLRY